MSLRALLAADLIGVTSSLSMYGAALAQGIYYCRAFPRDRLDQRLFVLTLLVLDTIHSYTLTDLTGKSLIKCHGMSEEDSVSCYTSYTLDWKSKVSLAVFILIPTIVQLFYARRIYAMSGRNKWLTSAVVILTAAGFGVSTTGVVTQLQKGTIAPPPIFASNMSALWALCDVLICASVYWYLRPGRTGVRRRVESRIERISRISIQSGLITSLCSVFVLITVAVDSLQFCSMIPTAILIKSYTNSALALLNARRSPLYNDASQLSTTLEMSDIYVSYDFDR